MKLRTRLSIAFLTITLIPVILSIAMVLIMWRIQAGAIEETYGISGATVESLSNSTQVLSNLTEKPYRELEEMADLHSGEMEDATYLDGFNQRLKEKKSYLLVRKDQTIVYLSLIHI